MCKESELYNNKEIILMIGPTMSGKSYYINKHCVKRYQVISESHIANAMKFERVPQDEDFKYAVMSVIARAHMIRGLPIVVDEPNLTIESLFIWKKYAFEYQYKLKGIIVDTPLDVCLERLTCSFNPDEIDDKIIQTVKKEYDRFEEIKQILNMKHQNVLDDFKVIPNGREQ